jgi:hypothetical protein
MLGTGPFAEAKTTPWRETKSIGSKRWMIDGPLVRERGAMRPLQDRRLFAMEDQLLLLKSECRLPSSLLGAANDY